MPSALPTPAGTPEPVRDLRPHPRAAARRTGSSRLEDGGDHFVERRRPRPSFGAPVNRLFALVLFLVLAAAALALEGSDRYDRERRLMVRDQLVGRDIRQPEVLAAMRTVPRHRFVAAAAAGRAYDDSPLAIGHGQTISQPYVVALMSQLLELDDSSRVLEIGTGSGYHAAILSRLAGRVYTIEIIPELAARARTTLADLGYANVEVRLGDGFAGWPEAAPFDGIVLTAAPAVVPAPLLDQLAVGGRMVLPVGGDGLQDLTVITRTEDGFDRRRVAAVRFVPMTGEARRRNP